MSNKVTWKDVYELFNLTYPRLSKTAVHWHPDSFGTILIYFEDGRKATFNYDEPRLKFLKGD